MIYFYIINSITADKFFVGHSENPWERLIEINQNDTDKYTGKHTDWTLAAVFEVSDDKSEVTTIEKFIKKQKTDKLIEKLIAPDFVPTGNLAKLVRVSNSKN